MAQPTSATEQIELLQQQIEKLKQQALGELQQKLVEARKQVSDLEKQLEQLTGKPSKAAAVAAAKPARTRRPSIGDEELKQEILKLLATEGKYGLSAKAIAEHIDQNYIRILKFIEANPKALKRQGSGRSQRFFLP